MLNHSVMQLSSKCLHVQECRNTLVCSLSTAHKEKESCCLHIPAQKEQYSGILFIVIFSSQ